MKNKRVTRRSSKLQESNVLDQFNYDNQQKLNSQEKQVIEIDKEPRRKSKTKKMTIQQPEIQQKIFVQKIKIDPQNQQQSQSVASIASKTNRIKKTKSSKNSQNQGIRILKQKQTQRLFQHLCNPQGTITVESLGKILVRAKKEFQIEDVENMIRYYRTIEAKLATNNDDRTNSNANSRSQASSRSKLSKNDKNKKNNSISISQQHIQSEQQEQNYEDQLDQSDQDEQLDDKTQLTYEQFKKLKNYFDK